MKRTHISNILTVVIAKLIRVAFNVPNTMIVVMIVCKNVRMPLITLEHIIVIVIRK